MNRRRLPIGIQTFREIREEHCYYVDKTAYIQRLLDEGKHYFLSRPRRFGKSLFLDTLKELFEGNEPLFRGLRIHDGWDWSTRYPVLRLSFGSGHFQEPDSLRTEVMDRLKALEDAAAITIRYDSLPARFRHLIETLHERTGQRVAVLIDEYDKPILDALKVPEVARGQPRLPAWPLRGHQGQRRTRQVHVRHRGEQVLQGEPVLGAQQSHRHHAGFGVLGDLRLHRGGPGRGVRTGAPGPSTGTRSVTGTTAMAGGVPRKSTTPSTSSCSSAAASSKPIGSIPARRPFWSRRYASGV